MNDEIYESGERVKCEMALEIIISSDFSLVNKCINSNLWMHIDFGLRYSNIN